MRNIFRTAVALCLGFVAAQASAQDEATYFKGKTVTIIAGSGSGGGAGRGLGPEERGGGDECGCGAWCLTRCWP
jgi:hypothetical protein